MLQRAARLRPQDIVKVLMKGLSDLNKQNLELKDRILHQDALLQAIVGDAGEMLVMLVMLKKKGMPQLLSNLKDSIMGIDAEWTACIDQLKDRVDMMKKVSSLMNTPSSGTTDQQPAEGEGSNTDLERAVRGPPVQITAPSPSRESI